MGERIRDKITAADCLSYAEACEQWAAQAPNDPSRQRLLDMARSWRDLERHMAGTKAGEGAGKRGAKKSAMPRITREARPGAAGRRSH